MTAEGAEQPQGTGHGGLTSSLLARACRIFLTLAYPGGEDAIPPRKRLFWALPTDQPVSAFLPPTATLPEVAQFVACRGGKRPGFVLRLGSAAFPHLKLQVVDHNQDGPGWVFLVDTHDAFSADMRAPPADHPDHKAWTRLQVSNRRLKEAIEKAWEEAGLLTFNGLLRSELGGAPEGG